jgi:hypothetical protein
MRFGFCAPQDALSVMYITERPILAVCLRKVKCDASPTQLITFTRCLREAPPIKYCDLPSAAFDQTGTFQLPDSIAYAWPLNTQHFGEQFLGNRQCVVITAVTHREQPTRQPLR